MAIHALNALVGSMFAEGGLMYQMSPPYGALPVDYKDYVDEVAAAAKDQHLPKIDRTGTAVWPMAKSMIQEIAANHLRGDPYRLDTIMFYLTNPMFSALDVTVWEAALKDLFVIETSPFPSETAMFADLVLPDHTYLERWQDTPTYPFRGWPMTNIRVPAVPPVHDTKQFSDVLIEIGKRIEGPTSDYFAALGDTETILKHLAAGFSEQPGDNGVSDCSASWRWSPAARSPASGATTKASRRSGCASRRSSPCSRTRSSSVC